MSIWIIEEPIRSRFMKRIIGWRNPVHTSAATHQEGILTVGDGYLDAIECRWVTRTKVDDYVIWRNDIDVWRNGTSVVLRARRIEVEP